LTTHVGRADLIDFESLPLAEGESLTNEIPGVTFSGAILAMPGDPRAAFQLGNGSIDVANAGEDFSGNFITDELGPGEFNPGVITVSFLAPVNDLSLRIADIDSPTSLEQVELRAYDVGGLVETLFLTTASPDTGDGVATLVEFTASLITVLEIDSTMSDLAGWGVDNIRYTATPEPSTLCLIGLILLATSRRRKRNPDRRF
jgi:hypothetical protein